VEFQTKLKIFHQVYWNSKQDEDSMVCLLISENFVEYLAMQFASASNLRTARSGRKSGANIIWCSRVSS